MRKSLNKDDLGLMLILKERYFPTGEILMAICQQCISLVRYMLIIPSSFSVIL